MEMKINCVIGVDPGAGGGIAVYVKDGPVKVVKMPKDISELMEFAQYVKDNYKPLVFLEKLSVRPDDIMAKGDGSTMGKLYRIQKMLANYEQLKAIFEAVGVPFIMVHPLSWQTKLGIRERGVHEDKAERKRRYRQYATKLYPQIHVTLWNADALLIMHFGRWVMANDFNWIKSNLPDKVKSTIF